MMFIIILLFISYCLNRLTLFVKKKLVYDWFILSHYFTENSEANLRKARTRVVLVSSGNLGGRTNHYRTIKFQANGSEDSRREVNVPSVDNMPTGPTIVMGDANFEINTGL